MTLFTLESRSRTLPARGRQFPKVEICSKVCMNETYPNISERRAVFFGHSAGRVAATRGSQTRGKSAREHVRARRDRELARIDRRGAVRAASYRPFEQGHWNVLVYELSATVIHLSRYTTCVCVCVCAPGRDTPVRPLSMYVTKRER